MTERLELRKRTGGMRMGDYFVHSTSFIDKEVEIGEGTRIWHFSHVQSGARIGKSCSFGQNVNVSNNVKVGNGCRIQNNVSLYQGVELEDYVFCGPSMVFTNDLTPRSRYSKDSAGYKKTLIKHDATLGVNCTIVCGHTIGEYAMVEAGSVVAKDVPAYALMAGVPAKQVGWVCECGQVLDVQLHCKDCKRRYEMVEGNLKNRVGGIVKNDTILLFSGRRAA